MTSSHDMSDRTTRNLRLAGWSLAAGLLALPAIAMQFTSEVNWEPSDFVFAGVMFAIVGGLFELAARTSRNIAFRIAVVLAVACPFLQLWFTLAVGIIGNEDNPANWTYVAMVVIAASVAMVTRGDARLLSRAMLVLAGVQASFSALHLLDGHFTMVIDLFFCVIFILSSQLFDKAASQRDAVNTPASSA